MAVKQKVVVKVSMENAKKRCRALKTAVGISGVESVALDGEKIFVVGEIDSVKLAQMLRKKMGYAELLSVVAVEENKAKEKKAEENKAKEKADQEKKAKEKAEEEKKADEEKKAKEKMSEVQPPAYAYPVWPPYQVQPVVIHDNCQYDPNCRIM